MLTSTSTAKDLTLPDGGVALDRLSQSLHTTKTELANVLGIPRESLLKAARLASPSTQGKLRDFIEILTRTAPWAGSVPQAYAWFRAQPLPSFGDQTAADLFREGRADSVKSYLSRIAVGGYA